MTFIYDTEVFLYDNLVVFKEFEKDSWVILHNEEQLLTEFMREHKDDIFIGFNSKSYDRFIIKALVGGLDPEAVKEISDFIVKGGQGWECSQLDEIAFHFNNVDIRDDMQQGLSLKAIEAHLFMDIEETEVDFDLDRPLTDEELEKTIRYCKHDVLATEQIVKLRRGYLESKTQVGALAGLTPEKALSMTNAKLTAALLGARRREYGDEREYVVPENLKREYIPDEVFEFFDRLKDKSIPDDTVFKAKLNFMIGRCPVTLGFGGCHAAIPHFIWKEGEGEVMGGDKQ